MTWHGTNSPYSKPTNISKFQGYGPHHNDNNYKLKGFALLQIEVISIVHLAYTT